MTHPAPADPIRKLAGGAMVVVGATVAVACVVGMVLVIGWFAYRIIQAPENLGLLLTGVMGGSLLVAILGLTPMVAGILLARWGRRLMQSPPADAFDDAP